MTNKEKKKGVEWPHSGIRRTTFREVRAEGPACEGLPGGAGAVQGAQAVPCPHALSRSQPPPLGPTCSSARARCGHVLRLCLLLSLCFEVFPFSVATEAI